MHNPLLTNPSRQFPKDQNPYKEIDIYQGESDWREPGMVELCQTDPFWDLSSHNGKYLSDRTLNPSLKALYEAEDIQVGFFMGLNRETGEREIKPSVGKIVRRRDPLEIPQSFQRNPDQIREILQEALDSKVISIEEYLDSWNKLAQVSMENSETRQVLELLRENTKKMLQDEEDVLGAIEVRAFNDKWNLIEIEEEFHLEKDTGKALTGKESPKMQEYELLFSQQGDNVYSKKVSPNRTLHQTLPISLQKLCQEITESANKGKAQSLKKIYDLLEVVCLVKDIEDKEVIKAEIIKQNRIGNTTSLLKGIITPCEIYKGDSPDPKKASLQAKSKAKTVLESWKSKGSKGSMKALVGKHTYFQTIHHEQMNQEQVIAWIKKQIKAQNNLSVKQRAFVWLHNTMELARAGLHWEKVCPKCKHAWDIKNKKCSHCENKAYPISELKRGTKVNFVKCPDWNLNPDQTSQYHHLKDIVLAEYNTDGSEESEEELEMGVDNEVL